MLGFPSCKPTTEAMLGTSGFPHITSPHLLAAWFHLHVFCTPVSVRFFYLHWLKPLSRSLTLCSLQHVMNAAARDVIDTRKFDHSLTQILHDDLHWLNVADRVRYKLDVTMHRCQHGKAPWYLVDCSTLITDVAGRQCLRSATHQLMVVPRHRLSTVGRRAFTVQGPTVWNSLPDDLRAQPDYVSFKRGLKTWLFSSY